MPRSFVDLSIFLENAVLPDRAVRPTGTDAWRWAAPIAGWTQAGAIFDDKLMA